MQMFEKSSGRPDLNPRPLDPQAYIRIFATGTDQPFPLVSPLTREQREAAERRVERRSFPPRSQAG